jgi:23S rRNA (pseudouridine1915-N3)-methyltransferase
MRFATNPSHVGKRDRARMRTTRFTGMQRMGYWRNADLRPAARSVPSMKARLIAVGERAPAWVAEGFAEYRKRLSHWLPLELVEVEPGLRGKGRDAQRAMQDEGARVLAAVPRNTLVVALDGRGRMWSSEQLAQRLEHWRGQGRDLAFLIGGPEGHAPEVLARADESWSLGALTLPHMLVRLVLAEQLYRAAAMLANHPYHRA